MPRSLHPVAHLSMLNPALILSALVATAAFSLPLTGHALERPCPTGLVPGGERIVVPTTGTACTLVTGTFAGSQNALGLPQQRRYIRITPQSPPSGPRPLLVLLHAREMTIEPMANLTRVGRLVRDHGITVILPEAIAGRFNDDPLTVSSPFLQAPLMDDVAFISTVIADELARGGLDAARVFIAGYSNGGFMSQRMVCERPELFAGLGSVASSLRYGLEHHCPAAPKPMVKVFMHGTADEVVLYDGFLFPYRDDLVIDGQPTDNALIAYRSAPNTALFWAARNGCSPSLGNAPTHTIRVPDNNDGTTVDYFPYNCAPGIPPLVAYRINGGGHTWPGSLDFTTGELGSTTTQLDATTALWTHFSIPNAGNQTGADEPDAVTIGGGSWGLSLLLGLGGLGLIRRWRQPPRPATA